MEPLRRASPEHRSSGPVPEFGSKIEPCGQTLQPATVPLLTSTANQTLEQTLVLDITSAMPDVKPEDLTDRLRRNMVAFVHDVVFLYRLLRHTETPWYARGLLFLPVMYLCSPVQLIPNFIPVVGQMDDVFVIWITKKSVLKLIDQRTQRECHDAATATVSPFFESTRKCQTITNTN
jgi:uncharacterized membrane protein YkvA (DUF1232 family)